AAARFRGELLDGLELNDCVRFQAWLTAEREAARSLRLGILAALAERGGDDDAEACLRWARERLAIEPLDEGAHAQVAGALARLGRSREALESIEDSGALLAREIGVAPSRGGPLEELRRRLLGGPGAASAGGHSALAGSASPVPVPSAFSPASL